MEEGEWKDHQSACSSKLLVVRKDIKSDTINEVEGNVSATIDFSEKSWKTDLTLVVEDTMLHVAKNVLALASPVFDKMFQDDFKESDADVLELPGKTVEDVTCFLRGFYPNTISKLSKEEALRVLPLADEYQVLHLKRRCDESLLAYIDEFTPTEELFRIMKEASLYDLKECLKNAVSITSEKSKQDIEEAARKTALPAEAFRELYQNLNDRLSKRNENLKLSNAHLTAQLEFCKTLKNYLSNSLEKSKLLNLDDELVRTGKTFLFKTNLEKRKPLEETVTICDVNLKIKFDYFSGYIHAIIRNNEDNEIECSLYVQIVVVNKMPTEQHSVAKSHYNFGNGQQKHEIYVAKIISIEDPKRGFVYKGKINLEVNVFLSTPKHLETKTSIPDE